MLYATALDFRLHSRFVPALLEKLPLGNMRTLTLQGSMCLPQDLPPLAKATNLEHLDLRNSVFMYASKVQIEEIFTGAFAQSLLA